MNILIYSCYVTLLTKVTKVSACNSSCLVLQQSPQLAMKIAGTWWLVDAYHGTLNLDKNPVATSYEDCRHMVVSGCLSWDPES